jgi:hypothetical protein
VEIANLLVAILVISSLLKLSIENTIFKTSSLDYYVKGTFSR